MAKPRRYPDTGRGVLCSRAQRDVVLKDKRNAPIRQPQSRTLARKLPDTPASSISLSDTIRAIAAKGCPPRRLPLAVRPHALHLRRTSFDVGMWADAFDRLSYDASARSLRRHDAQSLPAHSGPAASPLTSDQ